ncbi:MAG: M20/M25/M40 family metallo-hydrolase [Pirellulaceae bacterium]
MELKSVFCIILVGSAVALLGLTAIAQTKSSDSAPPVAKVTDESIEGQFLSNTLQLTYEGKRSGEGYFGADGTKIIYQSEQDASNPFFQIYVLDLETGESQRVSPGHGKTTCSWLHPSGKRALFGSTQNDPEAKAKQKAEIELREKGQQSRYAWDYDNTYDMIEYDFETKKYKTLTTEKGYDAEGSYSPDGQWIAFASNRRGFTDKLDEPTQKAFDLDQSLLMDVYIMRADGSDVKQLTDVKGYDGGPFFSADGKKICWRRLAEDGATAEIYTMNVDGSEQRKLTNLRAMSWAPYFHPSGKYLIFTTNKHGFDNFELYLVDAEGKSAPARVTATPGFDALASWDPTGERLTWTSNRNSDGLSQIYVAKWNHAAALKALGLDDTTTEASNSDPKSEQFGRDTAKATSADFEPVDFRKHVEFLCSMDLEGRMTGSIGERKATAYVAAYLDSLGLEPAGDDGSWYQKFDFPAGAKLGPTNALKFGDKSYEIEKQWRPLTFSKTGSIGATDVVFAGYGIVAPEDGDIKAYDSYVHLDVKDKWVMIFRYAPENTSDKVRQHLQFHASLRKKAMDARDKGARGIIVVSGPNSAAREQLVPLEKDFSLSGSSVAAISVTDEVAAEWLKAAGRDLKELQDKLDTGEPMMGIALKGVQLAAHLEIEQVIGVGRNVVGRLKASEAPAQQAIIIGAHIDHLGSGRSSGSLARDNETSMVHFGADDNASGVAAMLEIAENMAAAKKSGKLNLKRDVLFAAWSGEELGLHGSQHFVESFDSKSPSASNGSAPKLNLYPKLVACLNMDMVGRYDGTLILQGIGSADYWKKAAQKNAVTQLNLKLSNDTSLPTDASSFYRAGVPILSAFTGSHKDYHTPRDTPEKLNYVEAAKIAKLMGLIANSLATGEEVPVYKAQTEKAETAPRASMRAYVGSIPDYAGDVKGVLLSGVTESSPAAKAGLQGGDIVVEFGGRKVENIYDYTYAIDGLKPGTETTIVVMRKDERLELKITPGRR